MTSRPILAYDVRGPESGSDAPTLLFVHGFLNEGSVWNGVNENLAADFRCVAVDLPGHGQSDPTGAGTYDRDNVLNDLRAVLETVGAEQAFLVGHSLGGYLSLALAIEDPGRVLGLGLVGAGPGFRNPVSREKWNDSVRTLVEDRDLPDGMEAISMHVDSMVMDRMSEITVPATVIVGERDRGFIASADVFEKYLTVTSRTVVPGAGHMVHAKAAEATATALRKGFTN